MARARKARPGEAIRKALGAAARARVNHLLLIAAEMEVADLETRPEGPAFHWKRRGNWHLCYLGRLFVGEVLDATEEGLCYLRLPRADGRPLKVAVSEARRALEADIRAALGWSAVDKPRKGGL